MNERIARLINRVSSQSGRRQLVNATRIWNLADSTDTPEPILAALLAAVPNAFRSCDANSIRFAYWTDGGFRVAAPVMQGE